MRKTKIICTIGPASSQKEVIKDMIEVVKKVAIDAGFVKKGDLVVITSGPAIGTPGTTNLIKAEVIK
ncbi:MAG: pyruvate kinase [Candidatus Methanolliviera sp. GoM_asphalt]|nr:MAG: pyruvate kinase [Candidatus Methanolliviera sp. GoM_asphalt]